MMKLNPTVGSKPQSSRSSKSNPYSESDLASLNLLSENSAESPEMSYPNLQGMTEVDTVTIISMVLSEAETYISERNYPPQLRLPQTFQENFRFYAPCYLRRFYGERAGDSNAEATAGNENVSAASSSIEEDHDDEITMISQEDNLSIMGKETNAYNHLKILVVSASSIRSNMYLFPDSKSFETFKSIKSRNNKQSQNNHDLVKSGTLLRYDEQQKSTSLLPSDSILKNAEGFQSCLPLLKIEVPFLSSIRPKAPFMIFRQYLREELLNDISVSSGSLSIHLRDFCTVRLKCFQDYKRFTFNFQPSEGNSFTVLAFQHNYRPFTDFNYKTTRFRVFGTSRTASYPTFFNPELKLQVLDKSQPSLADNIVSKKAKRDFFKIGSNGTAKFARHDIHNPIPNPQNPLLKQLESEEYSSFYRNSVPRDMPPFGKFLDASAYVKKKPLVSKTYSEAGNIAVYEDSREDATSTDSHISLDTLVLSSIFLTLRESSVRSTVKRDEIAVF